MHVQPNALLLSREHYADFAKKGPISEQHIPMPSLGAYVEDDDAPPTAAAAVRPRMRHRTLGSLQLQAVEPQLGGSGPLPCQFRQSPPAIWTVTRTTEARRALLGWKLMVLMVRLPVTQAAAASGRHAERDDDDDVLGEQETPPTLPGETGGGGESPKRLAVRPLTVLEKNMMAEALQRQKANLVKKQVVWGREFQGQVRGAAFVPVGSCMMHVACGLMHDACCLWADA
jgi:hypothetical protein